MIRSVIHVRAQHAGRIGPRNIPCTRNLAQAMATADSKHQWRETIEAETIRFIKSNEWNRVPCSTDRKRWGPMYSKFRRVQGLRWSVKSADLWEKNPTNTRLRLEWHREVYTIACSCKHKNTTRSGDDEWYGATIHLLGTRLYPNKQKRKYRYWTAREIPLLSGGGRQTQQVSLGSGSNKPELDRPTSGGRARHRLRIARSQ